MTVRAIGGIERRQIQLADSIEHRPRQMPLGHPIAHRRRHQKHLLTVDTDELRAHTGRIPTQPDSTLFPTASIESVTEPPHSPPTPRPWRMRRSTSSVGAQKPIESYDGI